MAEIAFEGPDGVTEETVDAKNISDSGRVYGVRIKREDGSYLHLPYSRVYWITMTEEEGKAGYSSP
ncbi:hypothetical protein ACFQPA_14690 [Halomarina halobia]|uniref:Uncharacterized protein n=1 Tax=Halomarina halobia TaxID=3033386 RepID=A0ABD6A8P7_9EURY|nr:hypothetical protein [Halomarina sp. PSR21]